MKLSVECYAGHKADERPVRFWLDEKRYHVEAVLDQWYGKDGIFFKVRADDGNLYILRQQTSHTVPIKPHSRKWITFFAAPSLDLTRAALRAGWRQNHRPASTLEE